MYQAYVTRIRNIRKHSNADRLLCGECFGNTIIVGLDVQPEQLGIYFPVDGQLGAEYAFKNSLVRMKDESGNNIGGYLDPDKRNIKALKLRGEKSDGLFMPMESLAPFGDITTLREGDTIVNFNGHEICNKYIPVKNVRTGGVGGGNKTRKHKDPIAPLFAEHADTEQLAYNMGAFKPGDEVEITLKMHGTSGRTAYLPTLKGYKRSLLDKLIKRTGKPISNLGKWTMGNVELCLLGVRGQPNKYRVDKSVKQLVIAERTKHSKKPDEVRKRITQGFGDLPRIELFARQHADGWDCWGNEV